jgi:hypothetical protein
VGEGVGPDVGVGVGVAPADGVGVADPLRLGDGVAVVTADPEGVALGEVDVPTGPSATGRGLFGRAAKNRGGRLKVGTSSQKGACGSSEK